MDGWCYLIQKEWSRFKFFGMLKNSDVELGSRVLCLCGCSYRYRVEEKEEKEVWSCSGHVDKKTQTIIVLGINIEY